MTSEVWIGSPPAVVTVISNGKVPELLVSTAMRTVWFFPGSSSTFRSVPSGNTSLSLVSAMWIGTILSVSLRNVSGMFASLEVRVIVDRSGEWMSERKSRPDWGIALQLRARQVAAGRVLQVGREHREQHAVGLRDANVGVAEERGDGVAVEQGLVVVPGPDGRLPSDDRCERADDAVTVGDVVDGRGRCVREKGVDGHGSHEWVAAKAREQRGDELVGRVPIVRIGERHRAGQARLLALNHRERAEKVRRPQGRWIVALEETLEAGIGGDDGHRVGWVVRSTPEEGGPGGGEPTVERLERVAVDDEPGPDRGPDRVEGGGVEIARHRGARVDVRVEEALERSEPRSNSVRSVPMSPPALSEGRSSGTNEPAST